MAEILSTIAAHVRVVVARRQRELPLAALRDRSLYHAPTRGAGGNAGDYAESGIDSIEQIRRVEKLGIHAFLIGESLMRAPAREKN